MEHHVHIISVGKKAETAFNVIKSDMKVDKIILLNNSETLYVEVENEIRKGFEAFPIDVVTQVINPFDYDDVFKKVINLYNKESESHPDDSVIFHINFTMGSRITVAAMCSAAYSINADLYYVQESIYSPTGKDELIRVLIDNIDELAELSSKKKIIETFRLFSDGKEKSNDELRTSLNSPSNLSYRTKYLSNLGLIKRSGNVRNGSWILTEKGKQVMKRL